MTRQRTGSMNRPSKNWWRTPIPLIIFIATPHLTELRAQEVLTPDHVAKIRSVVAAEISPDGKHIAYLLSVPRQPYKDENGSPWTELHVIDSDGNSRPFITGKVNVGSIQWTPDGKGIAFLTKRGDDEHRALYVIPLNGGEATRVLSHETGLGSYSFNADGSRVAFLATDKKPKDEKKLAKKGFNAEIFEEEPRFTRVWIGTPTSDEKPRLLEIDGNASELHWSPTENKLAVALAPTPLVDDSYMKRKVRVVDAQTGEITARVENPGKLGQVAWSPDGKHLAIVSAADLNDPSPGRLMISPAADGPLQEILPNYSGHVTGIAWQDEKTVMFVGDEGVWSTLGELDLNGNERKTHVPTGKHVLRRLRLSKNGQVGVMLGNSPTHPTEVFVMRHGDTEPRRLTNSNPWLENISLAKQEAITYKARDGLDIEGILVRPLNERPGERYPLIVAVHGGPEAHRSNGWTTSYSSPGQVAAGQGYAVFYPNYRASTGRGVEFSKLDHGDPGGKEFDDLVDGVDHLVNIGLADRDRVGVTGGSYGGYATAWCSTYYSERFAAGVMFVGLSDLVSKVGTTDIPNEMTLVHWRKQLWDDWEFFLERSPIKHVQKAKTPLLILHGKDDSRVHPSQSMEMYRNLKTIGQTPVRLVWYPGEGHGNRKAAARYDYNLRMMRWFNHYLKGDGGNPPPHKLDYDFDEDDHNDEDTDEKKES